MNSVPQEWKRLCQSPGCEDSAAEGIKAAAVNSFDIETYDLFDAIVTAVQNASHSNSGPHHTQDPEDQDAG